MLFSVIVVHNTDRKIKQILSLPTDKIPNAHQGVYCLPCNDCNNVYIGKTNRQIKYRAAEHKNDTKNRKVCSAPAVHFMTTGHSLNFDNPTTLVKTHNDIHRTLWESIHITKRDNTLNFRDEHNKLPQTYHHLIIKDKKPTQSHHNNFSPHTSHASPSDTEHHTLLTLPPETLSSIHNSHINSSPPKCIPSEPSHNYNTRKKKKTNIHGMTRSQTKNDIRNLRSDSYKRT